MGIEELHEERRALLTQRRLKRFPGSARRRLMRLERRINGIEAREYAPERRYREQQLEELRRLEKEVAGMLGDIDMSEHIPIPKAASGPSVEFELELEDS